MLAGPSKSLFSCEHMETYCRHELEDRIFTVMKYDKTFENLSQCLNVMLEISGPWSCLDDKCFVDFVQNKDSH